MSCKRDDSTDSVECMKMLERDYKFYLSFENSLCLDYVTEKYFRTMQYDIIPITLNLANHSSLGKDRKQVTG